MANRETLAMYPLLLAQALWTRRKAPTLPEAAGPREGWVQAGPSAAAPMGLAINAQSAPQATPESSADPVRLLVVGDSSAAGVGVAHQDRALAGYLTRTVAARSGRSVQWQLKAKSGVTSQQALRLLQRDPPREADLAVVALGVNDVVQSVSPRRAVIHRARLADWLLEHTGVLHVVFAPLPPVHELPLLPQPLRRYAGDAAQRHNEAAAAWAATRSDVSHVPISMSLSAAVMAEDGFHPGEPVYRLCGEALGRFVADRLIAPGALASSPDSVHATIGFHTQETDPWQPHPPQHHPPQTHPHHDPHNHQQAHRQTHRRH